jgi:hypothetical protein
MRCDYHVESQQLCRRGLRAMYQVTLQRVDRRYLDGMCNRTGVEIFAVLLNTK